MKFLCVSCDEAMKLIAAKPPERGSLTVVYRCPSCSHEFAMLTNPYETQVVGSLGVNIGGEAADAEGASKCPFSSVLQEMGAGREDPNAELSWTAEATSRLENIPEFARPMAKTGIEKFAKDRGLSRIDEQVLDQAKDFFGM
jgi:DNA-directed RNA polymerase subunit RPC12/RpoP